MKNFLLLVLLCVFASCAYGPIEKPNDHATDVLKPTEPTVLEPIEVKPEPVKPSTPAVDPGEEYVVKVNIHSLTGFTKDQEKRFKKIAGNVQTIINTKEFKDAVLNHTHLGKKQFHDTEHTNEQVLQTLLKKDWLLEYRLEYIAKKPFIPLTVGYTYPSVKWIVINSKIFNTMGDEEIAANITHEYGGHKLGYGHSQKWNKARDYSVPYGIGSIMEKLYLKKFKN